MPKDCKQDVDKDVGAATCDEEDTHGRDWRLLVVHGSSWMDARIRKIVTRMRRIVLIIFATCSIQSLCCSFKFRVL